MWFASPLDQMIRVQVHLNHLTTIYAVGNHPFRTEIVIVVVTELLVANPLHLLMHHPRKMIRLLPFRQAGILQQNLWHSV